MKKYIKYILVFVTIFSFVLIKVDAQEVAVPVKPVLVAEVNIEGAKVTDQVGNTINVSFSLTNKKDTQSGVRYGVRLLSKNEKSFSLVDEFVYPEVFSLSQGQTIKKSIIYNAPNLPEGKYTLLVVSSNELGFPFDSSVAGEIVVGKATDGTTILPNSCKVSYLNKKELIFVNGDVVSPNTSLQISCDALNNSNEALVASPIFLVYEKTIFGKKIELNNQDYKAISFKANEKKSFSVLIPQITQSGSFVVKLNLKSVSGLSNTNTTNLVISGSVLNIMNLSLDKDSYDIGENAETTVFWSSSLAQVSANVVIKNKQGVVCGNVENQSISSGRALISVPIKIQCQNPEVSVEILDNDNLVLDQDSFYFETMQKTSPASFKTTLVILIIIILILLIGLVLRKKHNKIPTTMVFVLAIGLSMLSASFAQAETFTLGSGNNVYLTLDVSNPASPLNPRDFAPGDTIYVYGEIFNSSPTSKSISLSAVTFGNSEINIFPGTMIIAPGNFYFDQNVFIAPSILGSYNVDFMASLEDLSGGGAPWLSAYACFISGTKVTMADGTIKDIQDIKIGDVLKGENSDNTVIGYHNPPYFSGTLYGFNGEKEFFTEEHPFKTILGWKAINPQKAVVEHNLDIPVGYLQIGDILITENGFKLVKSINQKQVSPITPLFNFKLSGDRTYFADGYLVHNKIPCDTSGTCVDTTVSPHLLVAAGEPGGDILPTGCTDVGAVYEYSDAPKLMGGCGSGLYSYRGCYSEDAGGTPGIVACGNQHP